MTTPEPEAEPAAEQEPETPAGEPQTPPADAPPAPPETPTPAAPPGTHAEEYDAHLRNLIQESFLEMTRILMGRLNAIDPTENIESLRDELTEAVREARDAGSEEQEGETAIELIVEEKIKRAISGPLQELRSDIERLNERLTVPEWGT